ncbi:hypothetical protein [Caulobacter segnis]
MANVTGTFTATGQSSAFTPTVGSRSTINAFNISASGTFVATVQLERSFDNGDNWFVCSSDASGTTASWTAPFSVVGEEPTPGVVYRLNCTAFTSGTVTYRISQ